MACIWNYYFSSYTSSEMSHLFNMINIRRRKEWNAIDRLSIIGKSDLLDKYKMGNILRCIIFGIIESSRLYSDSWRKEPNRELHKNTVLNNFNGQLLIKHLLYSHLLHISQTIRVMQTRHVGHQFTSEDQRIGDVPLWTCTYGHTSVSQQVLKSHWYSLQDQ